LIHHYVGTGDLILETFAQRGCRDPRCFGPDAAAAIAARSGANRPSATAIGVGHCDHAVDRDAGSQFRPFEGFQIQRLWQRTLGPRS